MKTLYILCGLPFSGKSLFSKELARTTSLKRVSFDDEFEILKKNNKDTTYEIGINKVEDLLRQNLQAGYSVVYDSVNLSEKHRNKIKKLAEEVGAQAMVVYLKTPVEEIYRRQEQSIQDKSHHYLGKEFINQSIQRLEVPENCIVISNEKEKNDFLVNYV